MHLQADRIILIPKEKLRDSIVTSSMMDNSTQSIILNLIQCPLCSRILSDPYDCECCNKTYCKSCIQKFLLENQNTCPFCLKNKPPKRNPQFKKAITITFNQCKIKKSTSKLTDFISKLKFKCKNYKNGCKEELYYKEINDHESKCIKNKEDNNYNNNLSSSIDSLNRYMSFKKTNNKEHEAVDMVSLSEKINKIYEMMMEYDNLYHNSYGSSGFSFQKYNSNCLSNEKNPRKNLNYIYDYSPASNNYSINSNYNIINTPKFKNNSFKNNVILNNSKGKNTNNKTLNENDNYYNISTNSNSKTNSNYSSNNNTSLLSIAKEINILNDKMNIILKSSGIDEHKNESNQKNIITEQNEKENNSTEKYNKQTLQNENISITDIEIVNKENISSNLNNIKVSNSLNYNPNSKNNTKDALINAFKKETKYINNSNLFRKNKNILNETSTDRSVNKKINITNPFKLFDNDDSVNQNNKKNNKSINCFNCIALADKNKININLNTKNNSVSNNNNKLFIKNRQFKPSITLPKKSTDLLSERLQLLNNQNKKNTKKKIYEGNPLTISINSENIENDFISRNDINTGKNYSYNDKNEVDGNKKKKIQAKDLISFDNKNKIGRNNTKPNDDRKTLDKLKENLFGEEFKMFIYNANFACADKIYNKIRDILYKNEDCN